MFRLAPTPSGYLHKGNLFSFWLTKELAQHYEMPVFLRIDDLDEERCKEEYFHFLFESLAFFGIQWDEGPNSVEEHKIKWSQKYRMPLYKHYLRKLEDQGKVYSCLCSRRMLKESGVLSGCVSDCKSQETNEDLNTVSRFQTSNQSHSVPTFDGSSNEIVKSASVHDFVVSRRDGIPAYQIASLADDVFFGITHIVRGEDLLASTWAQMDLAKALGEDHFLNTHFFHHSLQMLEGEKISKSTNGPALELKASSRSALREEYEQWKRENNVSNYLTLSRGSMRA